jgi:hypothetical protein
MTLRDLKFSLTSQDKEYIKIKNIIDKCKAQREKEYYSDIFIDFYWIWDERWLIALFKFENE